MITLGDKDEDKKQEPLNQTRLKDDDLKKELHSELPSSFSLPPFAKFDFHLI
jgi:hypothetical protein